MKDLKKTILRLVKSKLLVGSLVMFIGSTIGSFINYLYHVVMGRMLGPADYGALASLISINYLMGVPTGTLSLVIVKYVSWYRGKKKLTSVNYFYHWINKKVIVFGLISLVIFLALSSPMAGFLHLDSVYLVYIVGLAFVFGLFSLVNTATFQGFLHFDWNVMIGIVNGLVKLGLGVLLVYLGFRVLGANLAILAGSLVGYFWSILLVKKIIGQKQEKSDFMGKEVFSFTLPTFFSILALTSLYTSDIVLVRHFLSEQEAGYYAALATLGKIIFFASNPITLVMFPTVSERHANGKDYRFLFNLSLGLVFLVCLGISVVYFLFPKLMVLLLFGDQYRGSVSYLWLFALFLSFYSLASFIVNYYLSIKKIKAVIFPVVAAVAQAIMIFFYHQNLLQTVWVSIVVLGLLLFSLLIFHLATIKKVIKI